jgi:hypothetical protein
MEREVDRDEFRALLESAVPALSIYSIGFALPTVERGTISASLGGSGTLVTIDKVPGILTANHVIELLGKRQSVGLIVPSSEIHNVSLNMEVCSCIAFACRGEVSDGPDLGLLIPPHDIVSTLEAKMSFYNLSTRQIRMLETPPPNDEGFWVLSGYAGEWTSDGGPEKGFSKVKLFKGLHGAGVVKREFNRGEFDYLIYGVLYNDLYEGPDTYGGFSGGGLWQLLVEDNGGKLQIAETLLSGVAFYQSEKIDNAAQVTREITCHGRRSIYQGLIDHVRAKRS